MASGPRAFRAIERLRKDQRGRAQFLPLQVPDPEDPGKTGARADGRDLTSTWNQRHLDGRVVYTAEELAALDVGTTRVLGLFDPSHMEWEADRAGDVGGESVRFV